eukprot:6523903-Prorocentrum_lima.AAC.1
MASQSGTELFPCFRCTLELPFFKMIDSWRPEHALDFPETVLDEEGQAELEKRGNRICPWWELDLRWEEWPEFRETKRKGKQQPKLLPVGA